MYCLHDATVSIGFQHYRFYVTKILEIWLIRHYLLNKFAKNKSKKMQHQ